jgi:hypothetical protein
VGQDLLGALELAEVHQRPHQVSRDPCGEHVRPDELLTQPLGGAKGAQGLCVTATRRLEEPAHHVVHQPAGG